MSKVLSTLKWGDAMIMPNSHTHYEQAPAIPLLTVKYFQSLASTLSLTKSKSVSTTPNLQHMKMGSVQHPSPKHGSAGGVVPEDQQRVNARGKEDRRIWLEL